MNEKSSIPVGLGMPIPMVRPAPVPVCPPPPPSPEFVIVKLPDWAEEKLNGIESFAQRNTITSIKLGAETLAIVNATAQIPVDDLVSMSGTGLLLNHTIASALALKAPLSHIDDMVKHITAAERTTWNAKYTKPGTGVPKSDLSENVQASLDKADAALPSSAASDFAPASLSSEVSGIEAKIPAQASAQNQLADKEFVNSSIQTNTATFRGTYNLVSDLGLTVSATHEQVAAAIATKLASLSITPENNDYCFVQVPTSDADPTVISRVDRYKCTVTESGGVTTRTWDYEWSLNNSSFTADQLAAINSGITSVLVAKLGALPTAVDLAAALLAKYEKPSTGIPKSDLASDVQTSLGKADTAIQTVKVNGTALTPDVNKAVNVEIPPTPVASVNNKTGAVVLSASDVGALPNYGNLVLNGSLTASNYLAAVQLIVGSSSNGLIFSQDDNYVYATVKSDGATVATYKFPKDVTLANDNGSIARWIDIIRAVQQIAPAWSSNTSYAQNALVSYSGVVYRKKSSGTSTTNSPTSDTTNWEAKKVSELFLPLTGGTVTGPLDLEGSNIELRVGNGGIDDQHARLFRGELQVSDGAESNTKLAYYKYDRIQVKVNGSTYTLTLPLATGTVALLQNLAPDYNANSTYALNNLCVYSAKLYRCTTAITTAEAWTAAHWTEATVEDVLTAIRSALNDKAPLASPAFTGTPTAPTPTSGDDSTKVATTAFVNGALPYAIVTAENFAEYFAMTDHAVNKVDAGNYNTIILDIPTSNPQKSRDFIVAVTCGSGTPPTLSVQGATLINTKGEPNVILTLTANATTVLRFTEVANGTTSPAANPVFVVTGGANGGGSVDPAQLAGKLDATSAAPAFSDSSSVSYDVGSYCTYNGKLYRCTTATTGGTWVAGSWTADTMTEFVQGAVAGVPVRYDMPTAVALVAANDEATLVCADRAVTNATIATGFSTLNLTFPTAISGKVRDFYLRITVAAGESAPALSIPQGITIENPDGAVPEIADGETSAASTTLVWFSETAPNIFTAKAETVKAVA